LKRSPPPPDPLRTALAEAIEDLALARKAVENHKIAVRKCWSAMSEAEGAARKAQEGIVKARVEAAADLAGAVVDGDDVVAPPSMVGMARAAHADALDHIENLKAARDQLRRTLPDIEQGVRDCEGRVEAAISAIEAPAIAQATLALQVLIEKAEPLRWLLSDVSAAYNSREIGWPGADAAKAEVEAANKTAFEYFTNDANPMKGTWTKRRAMLRQDPYVVLPDPLAPAPSPPPAA
jgi:hypothetical protein